MLKEKRKIDSWLQTKTHKRSSHITENIQSDKNTLVVLVISSLLGMSLAGRRIIKYFTVHTEGSCGVISGLKQSINRPTLEPC